MNCKNFKPFKPHLLRAYYAWFLENQLRGCVLLKLEDLPQAELFDLNQPTVLVDISPQATRNLEIAEKEITGRMSMNGAVIDFVFPMSNVLGIYAEGTELGEFFVDEMENIEGDGNCCGEDDECCQGDCSGVKSKFKVIR